MSDILFSRRSNNRIFVSSRPDHVFQDWNAENERWLFISPHDDDIAIGAGLHFIAAIESGISTHAVVATIGTGYCRLEHKDNIAQIRRNECCKSFEILGLPRENLRFLDYWATDILKNLGRRFTEDPSSATAIAGADGYQNHLPGSYDRSVRAGFFCLPKPIFTRHTKQSVRNSSSVFFTHREKFCPNWESQLPKFLICTNTQRTAITSNRRHIRSRLRPTCWNANLPELPLTNHKSKSSPLLSMFGVWDPGNTFGKWNSKFSIRTNTMPFLNNDAHFL